MFENKLSKSFLYAISSILELYACIIAKHLQKLKINKSH